MPKRSICITVTPLCSTVTPLFTLFSVYRLLLMTLLYALRRSVARQHYCLAKQAFLLIENLCHSFDFTWPQIFLDIELLWLYSLL